MQYRAKSKLTYSETQSRNVYYFTCKNAACLGGQPSKSTFPRNRCKQTQSGGDTGLRGVSVSTAAIQNRHIYFIILNVLFKKKITAPLEMI